MKKFFAISIAALLAVSCNFINDPDKPDNYDPLYSIYAYQNGTNISKTVYVEDTGTKVVEEIYAYKNNDWVFDCKAVTERTYDSKGNVTDMKQTLYDEAGAVISTSQARYENVYNGTRLSDSYSEVLNEDGEWVKSQHLSMFYMMDNNLLSDIVYSYYNEETEEYEPAQSREFSYYNNMVVSYETSSYDKESDKWSIVSENIYGYDDYMRLINIAENDKVKPADSTITTYYY